MSKLKSRKKKPKKSKPGPVPFYETPEVLQKKVDEYFRKGVRVRKVLVGPANNRYVDEIPVPTITGLVLYLGFSDRSSFYDYGKKKPFAHTIKKARCRIEREYEEQLQCNSSAGAIFALKNFGWTDKQEIEHSGEVTMMPSIKLNGKAPLSINIGDK